MGKYLLDRKGDKGLFFFEGNNAKFVIADICEDNGIGEEVEYWSRGNYYYTLESALQDFNKVEVR